MLYIAEILSWLITAMKTKSFDKPLYLNLNNFNTSAAQDCPYVLTSPRSLEACRKAGYKVSYISRCPLSDISDYNLAVTVLLCTHARGAVPM
jgi:hypothetical protein